MKKSNRIITGYIAFIFLFTSTAMIITHLSVNFSKKHITDTVSNEINATPEIVIDPGHGGEDGGASADVFLEKNLNLDVALTLSDLYTLFGYESIMTRTDDRLLYDHYNDLTDYSGKKKTFDLKNRLRIAEESGANLFIGIHMNKFPQEQYKGLQVYYSHNTAESENAAAMIQSYARKYIMPQNNREIKRANNSIFILNRITIPAVLVECGFMSNNEELALLSTKEYRNKLALTIFTSSAEFITQK